MRRAIDIILGIVALLTIAELAGMFFSEHFGIFPSLSSIGHYLINHLGEIFHHASLTLLEVLIGFACSIFIAFIIAGLMVFFDPVSLLFQSWGIIFQCLPLFLIARILVMLFGWTRTSVIVPIVLVTIFPMTLSMFRGFVAVPKVYINYFRFHGASRLQMFFKLYIPYARPSIFTGLRIGSVASGIGAVSGECAGASEGLGIFIQNCRINVDLEGVFCGVLVLITMSLFLYMITVLLENKLVKNSNQV